MSHNTVVSYWARTLNIPGAYCYMNLDDYVCVCTDRPALEIAEYLNELEQAGKEYPAKFAWALTGPVRKHCDADWPNQNGKFHFQFQRIPRVRKP